jgi:hypothetical protein
MNSMEQSRHFMELEGSLLCSEDPPPVAILSQMNPIHTSKSYFPKIHFNIILPSTPRSSDWLFPTRFSMQMLTRYWHKNNNRLDEVNSII